MEMLEFPCLPTSQIFIWYSVIPIELPFAEILKDYFRCKDERRDKSKWVIDRAGDRQQSSPNGWPINEADAEAKVSELTCHWTLRALSMMGCSKSKFFTAAALSASGIDSTALREFDSHFVKQKPPLDRSSLNSFKRQIALSSVGTDFRQSST